MIPKWIRIFLFSIIIFSFVALPVSHAKDADILIPEESQIVFTPAEQAWIGQHPVVRARIGKAPPLHFFDRKSRGISVDYLNLIAKRAGFTVQYVTDIPWSKALDDIKNHETIDLILTAKVTPERRNHMAFTKDYLLMPWVIFTQKDSAIGSMEDLMHKTVSVERDFVMHKKLAAEYPDIKLLVKGTSQEAIEAVATGGADAYIGNLTTGVYIVRQNNLNNVKVAASTPFGSHDQAMAIRDDWPELAGIIDKGLSGISEKERNEILTKYLGILSIEGSKTAQTRVALTSEEQALIDAHPVIRVHNEKDWPPFNYFEYGAPRGLSIDYMNLLAGRLGVKVEYVTGPSWNEFLGMIQKKDLDVMLNIVKTENRMKYLLYTEPYIRNLNVIISSQKHPYETIQELFGKTVAFPKGFFYEEVLTKSFPQIKRLPVEDTLASLKAVTFGKADAVLGKEAVARTLISKNMLAGLRISGEVKLGNPELEKLRIGVRDDWPLLQSVIMKAMAGITPQEMNQLRQKWLVELSPKKKLRLTNAERSWLEAHKKILLGPDPSWPPFEQMDSDGHYTGIASCFVKRLNERLGIDMKPVTGLTWPQVLSKVKQRELDVIPCIARTPKREKYLLFTKPYLKFQSVIVTREDAPFISGLPDLRGKSVGVVQGYITHEVIARDYPKIKLKTYSNVEEGLRAVIDKDIAGFVDNLASITFTIRQKDLEKIKVASTTEYTFDLSFGVRPDWPELIPILEKGLQTITKEEKALIYDRWINIQFQKTVDWGYIRKVVLIISAFAVFIIIVFLLWNRKLSKEVTERKRVEEQLNTAMEELESIFQNSQVGIMLLSGGRVMAKANQKLSDILGYDSPDEMIGISTREIHLSEERFVEFGEKHFNILATGEQIQVEYQFKQKDGFPVWCSLSGKAIDTSSPPDLSRGVLWIIDDITKRKQAEEKLHRNVEELERFNNLAVGREERMINLKEEVNRLLVEMEKPAKYKIVE